VVSEAATSGTRTGFARAAAGGPRGFGVAAVFWTTLSTILGAILFLRMGYAVGNLGLVGCLAVIALGHAVTIPAALAVAEIATNQKVAGGGVYYVLSRSFGVTIGGSIGIALYLSQAISLAFYTIAFAEAFRPLLEHAAARWPLLPPDTRLVAVPAIALLWGVLRLYGARLGLSTLYLVAGTLLVSLALFFAGGGSVFVPDFEQAVARVASPDPFFLVFAICFPAFTGLTAGVGLSGDLRDPKSAIPLGTLAAVAAGLVIYVLVAVKLAAVADPETLVGDPLVMSRIALWPPIIPIGLACATFSSALGSALVAPRTLQAIAADNVLPQGRFAEWLRVLRPRDKEPQNAVLLTTLIALLFVAAGDIDSVAQVITMFFLVTYGAICSVSLLERFAGDPTYRPAFRSRWYVSLCGALAAFFFMFQISTPYAILALVALLSLYWLVRSTHHGRLQPAELLRGTLFQLSRWIHLRTQRSIRGGEGAWRPAAVCLSDATFRRRGAFDLLRWIAHRHGFATYIHFVQGFLSRQTHQEAREALRRALELADVVEGNVIVDTMVSPSYTSAFTQLIQLPSSSGMENNLVVFEYEKDQPEELAPAVDHLQLAAATGFDVVVLGLSQRGFAARRAIHLWLHSGDYRCANLMILLAYVIANHPDWRSAELKMFDVVSADERERREEELRELVRSGRLPIAQRNVEVIVPENGMDRRQIINEWSRDADLTLIGTLREAARRLGAEAFQGYDALGNVAFVIAVSDVEIEREEEEGPLVAPEEEPAPAAAEAASTAKLSA
jgi:amino acid transporter/nucleotide-binding universal stress UspA family protein